MLRDVSSIDTRTSLLGQEVAFPVCVGATAMQRMAHSEGELATCRGRLLRKPDQKRNGVLSMLMQPLESWTRV